MSREKITIQKAISEIGMAEALADQAKQHYYRARKRLEGLYSPTSPKGVKALSDSEIAKLLGTRRKNTLKQHN